MHVHLDGWFDFACPYSLICTNCTQSWHLSWLGAIQVMQVTRSTSDLVCADAVINEEWDWQLWSLTSCQLTVERGYLTRLIECCQAIKEILPRPLPKLLLCISCAVSINLLGHDDFGSRATWLQAPMASDSFSHAQVAPLQTKGADAVIHSINEEWDWQIWSLTNCQL